MVDECVFVVYNSPNVMKDFPSFSRASFQALCSRRKSSGHRVSMMSRLLGGILFRRLVCFLS